MQKSFNGQWMRNEKEEFLGIDFGKAFSYSHESGIDHLSKKFGTGLYAESETERKGIDSLKVTKLPPSLVYEEGVDERSSKAVYVLRTNPAFLLKKESLSLPDELFIAEEKGETVGMAWDNNSFGVIAYQEHRNDLAELFNAFQRKDVAIGMSLGKNINPSGSLCLLIVSKMSEQMKNDLLAKETSEYLLAQKSAETRIHHLLQEAGKKYRVLSPRWKDEEKHVLTFWLDPAEEKYNPGWYSLSELKEWIEEKGPIVEKNF